MEKVKSNKAPAGSRGGAKQSTMLALLITLFCMISGTQTKAADDENLLMTITTVTDTLRFTIAADEMSGVIKVDYGDGELKSYNIEQGVKTQIEGITKSEAAQRPVKVYGDESLINSFYCVFYGLTALDLSGCPKLVDITCEHNMLTSLDVSKNPELLWLNARYNQITNLNLTNCNKLQTLWLDQNKINTINLTPLTELVDLRLIDCDQLRNLNIATNTKLTRLEAPGTPIYSIDVSNNPELYILDVSMTNIYNIDVTHNSKLTQLGVGHLPDSYYKLSSLDVSQNPNLFYLNASGNRLTEIDLSNNTELQALNIWENQLTNIDLSNNTKLKELLIRDNYLTYNTLPINDNLTYYIYNPQKPVKVDYEYPVGGELDLTEQVYNPQYKIDFSLYVTSSDIYQDPGRLLVEGEDYSIDKGVVRFLKAQADSVYCSVTHEKFPEMALQTTKFMVRNPEDMGKSSYAFSFSPNKELDSQLLIRMVAYEADSKVEVDFGDGELQEYTIGTSSSSYILGNLKGETVKVYIKPGVQIKELNLPSGKLKSIDISKMYGLRTIDISDNELTEVDFSKNFVLQTVKVNKNQLTNLEFSTNNQLTSIDCSENSLTSLKLKDKVTGVTSLNCSSNQLEEIDVMYQYGLSNLQARNNKLKELRLYNNTELTTLYVDDNDLTTLDLSYNTKLNFVSITNNYFKFSTMPKTTARYLTYNRQKDITISKKGHSVDLSSEKMVHDAYTDTDIATTYVWKDASGKKLYEDDEYAISGGITTFLGPDYEDLGEVYCEMTNQVYSGLTLKTTFIQPADLPSEVLVEVDVKSDAGTPVKLNMAAAEPIFLYVDYGDGNLQECSLATTYKIFESTLGTSKKVKIYCYDTNESPITVFSLMDLDLNSIDLSKLSEVYCLNLSNSGLKTLDISNNLKIRELLLADCRFSEMDLSNHTELTMVNLRNNRFTTLPTGLGENVNILAIDGNKIEEMDLSGLPNLRIFTANDNKLTSLDLSGNAGIQQISLSNNSLSEIKLPEENDISVIYLDNNNFRFSTLPGGLDDAYYIYSPQALIEIEAEGNYVDISDEYDINGSTTEYLWRDSERELEAGVDYLIERGVTEFLVQPSGEVTCVMTNTLWPNIELTTTPILIQYSGAEKRAEGRGYSLEASKGMIRINYLQEATTEVYDLNGRLIKRLGKHVGEVTIDGLAEGIYIVSHTIGGNTYNDKAIVR
ncbi:MAG: hypothetical protein ACI304_04005 [Lepagella sp.]